MGNMIQDQEYKWDFTWATAPISVLSDGLAEMTRLWIDALDYA